MGNAYIKHGANTLETIILTIKNKKYMSKVLVRIHKVSFSLKKK